MLRRSTIIFGEILIGIVAVVALLLFGASLYVDSDEFKQRFLITVEELAGVPVALDGELDFALYPNFYLEVNGLSIGDFPEPNAVPLASADKVRVSVNLLPLVEGRIDLDTIVVEGMTINLIKSPEGVFNWQPFFDRQAQLIDSGGVSSGEIDEVTFNGVELTDATISFKDNADGDSLTLSGVEFRSGDITPDKKVSFEVKSRFTWPSNGVEASLSIDGDIGLQASDGGLLVDNGKLEAVVGGGYLPEGAEPAFITSDLLLDGPARKVSLENILVRFLGVEAVGSLESGDLDEAISAKGTLRIKEFNPSSIIKRHAPKLPLETVEGLEVAKLSTSFAFNEDKLDITGLTFTLDDQTIQGDIALTNYAKPVFFFKLSGNKLDLDRYLPLFKTGTPFIWDDFPLELARLFKGKGTASLGEFKVVDLVFNDIQVAADALSPTIVVNANAVTEKDARIAALVDMTIGKNEETENPTLESRLSLTASSPPTGFALLDQDLLKIDGYARFNLTLDIAPLECPADERSMNLMRNLSGSATVVFDDGKALYGKKGEEFVLDYSEAECGLKFTPSSVKGGDYGYTTTLELKGRGGTDIRTFALFAQGPIGLHFDKAGVFGRKLLFKANAGGKLINGQSDRMKGNGFVFFDTDKSALSLVDTTFRVLETTVKGDVHLAELDKTVKGTGKLEVPGANVRRMVYLLNQFVLRTKDTEALKNVSFKSNFRFDKAGFKLTNTSGAVDGVPFTGEVAGKGYDNPKLVYKLDAGKFDLDRYLPPKRKGGAKSQPVEMPFAFLRWLNLSGDASFEEFKLYRMRIRNLTGHTEAEKGRIHVSGLAGNFYGGRLKGDWTGTVRSRDLTTRLKLSATKADGGKLMTDLAKRDYIRGKSNIELDLTSTGTTDEDIVKNLGGKTSVYVSKGSYKFAGYPSAKAEGKPLTQMDKEQLAKRTKFKKANLVLDVQKGVLVSRIFRVDSTVLQSHGKGWVNLPQWKMDLSIRNDFVAVPSVTVRLVGKLDNPEVKIPTERIVSDTVYNVLSIPEKSFKFLRDIFE